MFNVKCCASFLIDEQMQRGQQQQLFIDLKCEKSPLSRAITFVRKLNDWDVGRAGEEESDFMVLLGLLERAQGVPAKVGRISQNVEVTRCQGRC